MNDILNNQIDFWKIYWEVLFFTLKINYDRLKGMQGD